MVRARLLLACSLALGCSTTPPATADASAPAGGAALGPADTHCALDGGSLRAPVQTASCSGAGDAGAIGYGSTMFGSSGADDACKYDVAWTSTSIRANEDATVTVTLSARATGKPVPGAQARIEAFLSDVHPAPNALPTVTETAPGTYEISPMRLDRSGRWTMRFHFFDVCSEQLADSPHGHAAFYVDVP